jgi:hypothetical protein
VEGNQGIAYRLRNGCIHGVIGVNTQDLEELLEKLDEVT